MAFFINPKAREAFEEILLPQMQGMVATRLQAERVEVELCYLLDEAMASKNALYNMLISSKPMQLNDEAYFSDLKTAINQWVQQYE